MPLSPGDRFDRYVIEELLGEGGMAQVYRAHDPRLHRHVALKVLRLEPDEELESPSDPTSRVLLEARAAAALDHPNAVSVFDVGEARGQLFIAMELVVGKSLRAYVNDVTIRWETKLRWMVDAARALGAAHERGLVHRDVKPENVMVRSDGVVKVLDFGIAKRLRVDVSSAGQPDESRYPSSSRGRLIGTPWYLSPEQLRDDTVDGRADQFAWAVTAYELLTGKLPWPKNIDGFQLVLTILNKVPDPPSQLLPVLPSIVDATIVKAMAKSASARFDNMESIAVALESIAIPSRRSWAEIPEAATTKTDPAPPMDAPNTGPVTHAATTLSQKPTRSLTSALTMSLAAVVAVTAALGAVALVSTRLGRAKTEPPGGAAPSPSHSASTGVAITDLPPPRSTVPEALAAYRASRQSLRDADWNAAMTALVTATERDPTLAAGFLRLAFMRSLESVDEGQVRSTFMQAVRNRATLDDRDQALLDALAPYLQSDPSDPPEAIRRLEALHDRWPLDAELAYILGSVRYDRGDFAPALASFEAAIAIDADFAMAWSSHGGCLMYMGRFDDARTSLEQAFQRSRAATEPLWYLATLDEQQGQCDAEEAHARTWLSRDPEDWYAYTYLARALAGGGKPADTVLAALEQEWARLAPVRRAQVEPLDRALLAIRGGDFAGAEEHLRVAELALAAEPGAQAHGRSSSLLAHVAEESGQAQRAREVASAYLARKDAWAPTHRVDNTSIFLDAVPTMLGVLGRTGGAPPAQLEQQRTAWLDTWRARTSAAYVGDLWLAAWADPASTPEHGVAALQALPAFGGVPPFTPDVPAQAWVGHVYLLANRLDDAVGPLERGARSCTVLLDPFGNTRAWLDLGAAREAKGDVSGACDAYRVVVERWGHGKPRSVTGERARARMGALKCR